jgi:hypothetical protein
MNFDKDPDAHLDYSLDWAAWLGEDTIASSLWVLPDTADDLTVTTSSHTPTVATAWISGGLVGSRYKVACRVTTAGGRVDDRSITLKIKER